MDKPLSAAPPERRFEIVAREDKPADGGFWLDDGDPHCGDYLIGATLPQETEPKRAKRTRAA